MYTSFTAQNFRLFANLTVEPLGRINLITGKNNVGKSALLEALWLYSAPTTARYTMVLNNFRGLSRFPADAKIIWDNLFFGFDTDREIMLQANARLADSYQLLVRLDPTTETRMSLSGNGDAEHDRLATSKLDGRQLTYELVVLTSGQTIRSSGRVEGDEVIFSPPSPALTITPQDTVLMNARHRAPIDDTARRYSNIQRRLEEERIVQALQVLESRLKDIRIELYGGVPRFQGQVVGIPGVQGRMPLGYMGDGLNRLLEIAVAIAAGDVQVVLIDEIENGLHYTVMAKVWQAIEQLAQDYGVQVFATTHSEECIQAAYEAFGPEPGERFKLHRLEEQDGRIVAVTYTDEALRGAMKFDVEVR